MLVKWYREAKRRRKVRNSAKAYESGFEWAMSAYFLHQYSVYELEAYTLRGSAFDKGADCAIRIIIELYTNRTADAAGADNHNDVVKAIRDAAK